MPGFISASTSRTHARLGFFEYVAKSIEKAAKCGLTTLDVTIIDVPDQFVDEAIAELKAVGYLADRSNMSTLHQFGVNILEDTYLRVSW